MPSQNAALPVRAQAARPKDVLLETHGSDIHVSIDDRRYRIRGLEKNMSIDQLRVNILAQRDELVHLDTVDLCLARSRAAFIKAAAAELYADQETIKKDVGRLLLELERLQDERIAAAKSSTRTARVEMTAAERDEALGLLKSPDLVERILADYQACGLVGEETNKLVCYLACVSRLLKDPLAVLIQSASAAGKTSLMDATLAFMPPEHVLRYSAMTGQSLYYMGRQDLKHKILAVSEEEGVPQASYALKLLQSDGRLRIAAAAKSSGSGRQQTESYEVEGPVMMFLTTTEDQPDPELENRCLTLSVSESPEQTAAIQAAQRAEYSVEGLAARNRREKITRLHQHAQRLLQAMPVMIPWSDRLTFRHDRTRMRRDHAKYLALIASAALLRQHQRPRKTHQVDGEPVEYLEATIEDIELAGRLAGEALGRSLEELLPQSRQLLVLVDRYVGRRSQREKKPRERVRFTQRELREALGWGDYQLRRHLARLVELEYVLWYPSGAKNQRQYVLLYDGQGDRGERFVLGLVNTARLQAAADSPAACDHGKTVTVHGPVGAPLPTTLPRRTLR